MRIQIPITECDIEQLKDLLNGGTPFEWEFPLDEDPTQTVEVMFYNGEGEEDEEN